VPHFGVDPDVFVKRRVHGGFGSGLNNKAEDYSHKNAGNQADDSCDD
jgi:hypothetical protein